MMPSRRKKWTEEEERTLIDKYAEMFSDGTLAKMKTREKKFRPVAAYVNVMHHARDPVAFPWQWSWKDASTKVQNMRHQYLLVKQKIMKPVTVTASASASASASSGENQPEEFDWFEGITYWPNFLRYRDVFGDIALEFNNSGSMTATAAVNRNNGSSFAGKGPAMDVTRYSDLGPSPDGSFGVGIVDGDENGVLDLGFEYDGDEGDENNNNSNNNNRMREDGDDGFENEEVDTYGAELRRREKRSNGFKRASFLVNQSAQVREREARFEDREQERQRREQYGAELEQERERMWEEKEKEWEEGERVRENRRKERFCEWKAMEECAERERQRRDEELRKEREWEERMEQRRLEWKKRMDDMLSQHQAAMNQIQSRILHDQQALAGQLIGLVSQWTGHPAGLSDHTEGGNPYLSPMMQNLHNVSGIVHGENRVDGDNQDDQFIVDG